MLCKEWDNANSELLKESQILIKWLCGIMVMDYA